MEYSIWDRMCTEEILTISEQLTAAQLLQGDEKSAALSATFETARLTFLTPNEVFDEVLQEEFS